jgi:hypothetical protein
MTFIDLANPDWEAIRISSGLNHSPASLQTFKGMLRCLIPKPDGVFRILDLF